MNLGLTTKGKGRSKPTRERPTYNEREQREWLSVLMADAKRAEHGQVMRLESIPPERAQYLLDKHNPGNRKTQEERIQTMALDMRLGRWFLNGDTIVIANTGDVNNGQHRLEALVLADLPLLTWVCVGPVREARTTNDTGVGKSVANFAEMEGYDNARKRAVAASTLLTYEQKVSARWTAKLVSRKAHFDYMVEHDNELTEGLKYVPTNSIKGMPPGRMLGVFCILRRAGADPDTIRVYLDGISNGNDLPKGSPILYARERIQDTAKDTSQVAHDKRMELMLRAWNYWRDGSVVGPRGIPTTGKVFVPITA